MVTRRTAAIAGAVGLGVVGAAAFLLSRAKGPGGGGGGGCGSEAFECSSGKCCPLGDLCANADGSCPEGTTADPSHLGCCVSACPTSCTLDSQCTACGAGFVCEGGECTKQTPSSLTASSITATIPQSFSYIETCCNYVFEQTCKKCAPSWRGGSTSVRFQVLDAFGRGIPGIRLLLNSSGSGYTIAATPSSLVTDATGTVAVLLTATAAPDDYGNQGNSNYPCSACGSESGDSGFITAEYGTIEVSAPGFPSLGTATVLVEAGIDWVGNVRGVLVAGNCGCA